MYTGTLLEFLNMGGSEIMLILAVVLLLFGGKKLPELARGLGKGIRDFKDASEGVKREIHRNINSVDIDEDLRRDDRNASRNTAEGQETPKVNNEVKSDLPRETPIENAASVDHVEKIESNNKI